MAKEPSIWNVPPQWAVDEVWNNGDKVLIEISISNYFTAKVPAWPKKGDILAKPEKK